MTKTVQEEAKAVCVGASAPEESRSVASFPKNLAQILPQHKSHCFCGEASKDDTGTSRLGPTLRHELANLN